MKTANFLSWTKRKDKIFKSLNEKRHFNEESQLQYSMSISPVYKYFNWKTKLGRVIWVAVRDIQVCFP